ncbi:type II toxin-antitoxin system YhaV family toxin [Bradyrhizobium sp. 26S5]|uniref:type II toxin-antitoxin system YhaV family toxin n=1 Tax=Bradyrhizobium sp. 26S5 TaxID=3139729 RepID=UPI0030CB6E02
MSDLLTINGWTIYAHPLFLQQLNKLVAAVARDKERDPRNYAKKANAKLLKAITTVALERIPADPANQRYRLGASMGSENKHWLRDKFGNGRFRLFFRYDSSAKVIIYAWVNDENTLRTYGAKSDAYAVFSKMLSDGNPPTTWKELLAACQGSGSVEKVLTKEGGA